MFKWEREILAVCIVDDIKRIILRAKISKYYMYEKGMKILNFLQTDRFPIGPDVILYINSIEMHSIMDLP